MGGRRTIYIPIYQMGKLRFVEGKDLSRVTE